MNILEKLNRYEEVLVESGIRRITELAKRYKQAEIYFHKDLDGVTSAVGMKQYLKSYGIKTVAAYPIQYGSEEYAVPKGQEGLLKVLVDFAHGKPTMHIHTDHHEGQSGVEKSTSTSFVHTPSNAAYISQVLSPSDLFPPKDVKIISTVDSADFASQGLTPDDIMRAVFKVDKSLSAKVNRQMMGFAANKLILAHKNKHGFLSNLVMSSSPSLVSLYNNTIKLAKEAGYRPPEQLEKEMGHYVEQQKSKIRQGNINDIKKLKNGESMMIGDTVVQYGGGAMAKGNLYDRYTVFKNHPDADFLCIAWPMGLVQVSKNPFKKDGKDVDLSALVKTKVLPKFKNKMQNTKVTLDYIKWSFENDKKFDDESMGFTFKDLIALFDDSIKGLSGSDKWKGMVQDITNKHYKDLSNKQRNILKKVSISLWDIVNKGSGGHKSIQNLSSLSLAGKGFIDLLKDVQTEIVKALQKV
jgi:hypothetical protein